MTTLSTDHTNETKVFAWLLFALCIATLFPFLGETLFNTRGEPREAVVALSMIQDGNWVLPVNNGVDLAYKPPFFHWIAALCSLPFGTVSEYTARMPSALALCAMVMAGYFFYARRCGARVALLMAAVTLGSFEVHRAGIACRVDMVLTCMMVLSLYALYSWVERGMKGLPLAGIVCLSGAFLSKGPVGAALPCLVVAIFAWMRGRGFWAVLWRMAVVGLLSLVLPAVWYVAAYGQGGERFLHLVYEENILRLLGKMTYESHVNPWTYNVVTIVSGMLPFTLLLLFSLFAVRWRKVPTAVGPLSTWWKRFRTWTHTVSAVELFTLLSAVVVFVFYCIPKSKRSVYLLPVYPFLAYYTARCMMWLSRSHRTVLHTFNAVMATLAVVLTLVFAAVRMGLVPESLLAHGKSAASNLAMLAALRDTPLSFAEWAAAAVPLVAAGLYVKYRRHVNAMACTLVLSVFFALDGVYQPLVLNTKSDRPVADFIARVQPEGRIYSFRTDVCVGNEMHPFTVNFYLADRVAPFEAFMPESGYVIVGNDEMDEFCKRFPDYAVHLVKDFDHRSCDDHKMMKLYFVQKHASNNAPVASATETPSQTPAR